MRLLYLVHDLGDAAVARRRRFLQDGGGHVVLIGFRRHRGSRDHGDMDGLCIGQTRNGRMLRRTLSTIRAIAFSRGWRDELLQADAIIARSLEMLLLAVAVRRMARVTVPIAYECLDVHRLMTRPGLIGRLLRWIERRLLDSTSLLIVSSPSFIESYFSPVHGRLPPWRLLENKLLASEMPGRTDVIPPPSLPAALPWRIGWFGIIRCKRSLELLAALAQASNGCIEIVIRGRVAYDVIPDFDAQIAAIPGLIFGGPYDRTTQLAAIYGQVHFNWAIDFYEDGLNSAWLLPNRLYEGSAFGAVPIALRAVETGHWLSSHGCGLLLDQPIEQTLPTLFAGMIPAAFEAARDRVLALDRAALIETTTTAASFILTLSSLAPTTGAVSSSFAKVSA